MNPASLQRLQQKGADLRKKLWGVDSQGTAQMAVMHPEDGTDEDYSTAFRCYFSTGSFQETLEPSLMFKEAHDHEVRVSKSETNCDPTVGKVIKLLAARGASPDGDLLVRIEEILGNTAVAPEWIFGCKALF